MKSTIPTQLPLGVDEATLLAEAASQENSLKAFLLI